MEATCWLRKHIQEDPGAQENNENRVLYIMKNKREVVSATKRSADREPLPKLVQADAMDLDKILNPFILGQTPPQIILKPPKEKTRKSKTRGTKKMDEIGSITERAALYDVVSALTNAASGLSFGQILQGEVFRVQKELRKLFGKNTSRRKEILTKRSERKSREILKVCPLTVHGQGVYSLLNTGAVPNLISTSLAKQLGLTFSYTKETITLADGTMTICHGAVRNIPVVFGELKTKMNFLVVDGVPIGVLIGIPEMEKLNKHIDLGGQYVELTIGRKSVRVGLELDHTINKVQEDESEDENLTTDSSTTSSADVSENESEESILVAMAVQGNPLINRNKAADDRELLERGKTVAEKLSHLAVDEQARIEGLLHGEDVLAWFLHDLRSAEMTVRHSFELIGESPIHHRPRRLSPRHNQVVESEVKKMLEAGVIAPASTL